MSKTIEEIYAERCTGTDEKQSAQDIFTVLPTLRSYAEKCRHITEIGVRKGNSAAAFLCGLQANGGGTYVGCDIAPIEFESEWPKEIPGVTISIRQCDSVTLSATGIETTDLLFVDGYHHYPQPLHDLSLSPYVRRWIIMHDTSSRWIGGAGPRRSRDEFLSTKFDYWALIHHCDEREGFSILERIKPDTHIT